MAKKGSERKMFIARKPRTPTDPTVSAMRALDKIFNELDEEQLVMVLTWVAKKYKVDLRGKFRT